MTYNIIFSKARIFLKYIFRPAVYVYISVKLFFIFAFKISAIIYSASTAIFLRFGVISFVFFMMVCSSIFWVFIIFTSATFNIQLHNLPNLSLPIVAIVNAAPLIGSFYYKYKYKLNIVDFYPTTRTAMKIKASVLCPSYNDFPVNHLTKYYEMHLNYKFCLKSISKKEGETYSHNFLAKKLAQEISAIKKYLGENTIFYGFTHFSVQLLLKESGLLNDILIIDKRVTTSYLFKGKKKVRLFILTFKK